MRFSLLHWRCASQHQEYRNRNDDVGRLLLYHIVWICALQWIFYLVLYSTISFFLLAQRFCYSLLVERTAVARPLRIG